MSTVDLELDRVTVRAGRAVLLDAVSLRLSRGDFVVFVGPNGAGKSTLVRVALGLIAPAGGEVRLAGRTVERLSPIERARHLACLAQRPTMADYVRAIDLVVAGRFRFGEPYERAAKAGRLALARVGAEHFADRTAISLSGGELQRVSFAATLAQETPLVLFDEPSSSLDPRQQSETYAMIGDLWRRGHGILGITHDVNLISHAIAPSDAGRVRVIGLAGGAIRFETTYDAPDLDARLSDLYGVPLVAVAARGHRWFVMEPRQP